MLKGAHQRVRDYCKDRRRGCPRSRPVAPVGQLTLQSVSDFGISEAQNVSSAPTTTPGSVSWTSPPHTQRQRSEGTNSTGKRPRNSKYRVAPSRELRTTGVLASLRALRRLGERSPGAELAAHHHGCRPGAEE